MFHRLYEWWNPKGAEERQRAKLRLEYLKRVENSGYSEGGASRHKNAMKGFKANSYTPLEDIDQNLDLLRQRCRTLFMTSPIAASAIKLNRTNQEIFSPLAKTVPLFDICVFPAFPKAGNCYVKTRITIKKWH